MENTDQSKRKFIKTVAYVTPVIATFSVAPAIAGIGSYANPHHKKHRQHKGQHGPAQNRHHGKNHKFFDKKNRYFSNKSASKHD